jgi:hypothetical protein
MSFRRLGFSLTALIVKLKQNFRFGETFCAFSEYCDLPECMRCPFADCVGSSCGWLTGSNCLAKHLEWVAKMKSFLVERGRFVLQQSDIGVTATY